MFIKNITKNKITNDFNTYIELYPKLKEKIIRYLYALDEPIKLFFMKAITQLPSTDIISINLEDLSHHVEHIYYTVTNIPYCKNIPIDIIFNYVLPYRINDENFTLYSLNLFRNLIHFISANNIKETIIDINYWCFSKATYKQTNDRTQNALATISAGYGRCGEESVLLVSALRSVGIPARQCYCPYWSHCDDNHAWVEVYTGCNWEFIGACEPEESLNIGWFNNAASKAGIIRHRLFNFNTTNNINQDNNYIFSTLPTTSFYGTTFLLNVNINYNNIPLSYIKIGIYTINYCSMCLLIEKTTDKNGHCNFNLGVGNYLLFCKYKDLYIIKQISSKETAIDIDIRNNITELNFNLIPPNGNINKNSTKYSIRHLNKLKKLSEKRKVAHKLNNTTNRYIKYAQLNKEQIDYFLTCKQFSSNDKTCILNTLEKKDFIDINCECLIDMFYAFKYRNIYPKNIFLNYLLPLRVENEYLYEQRLFINNFLYNKNIKDILDIYNYLTTNCVFMDEFNYSNLVGDIKGVLKYNILTKYSLPIHIVQICRAIGIPAYLDKNRYIRYYNNSKMIIFKPTDKKFYPINIINKSKNILNYGVDFTISKIENSIITKLKLEFMVEKNYSLTLQEGLYIITQSTRQIDGSHIGKINIINLDENYCDNIYLEKPINDTKQKLSCISLPTILTYNSTHDKEVFAYIDVNTEPTEHLLNEVLENEDKIKKHNIRFTFFAKSNTTNSTLNKIINNKLGTLNKLDFNSDWQQLRVNMNIGDERLPFIVITKNKKGLFAFANYNVGTIDMIFNIYNSI